MVANHQVQPSPKPPAPRLSSADRAALHRLDTALGALAAGLARLLVSLPEPSESSPASLELPAHADLSVPAGEHPDLRGVSPERRRA